LLSKLPKTPGGGGGYFLCRTLYIIIVLVIIVVIELKFYYYKWRPYAYFAAVLFLNATIGGTQAKWARFENGHPKFGRLPLVKRDTKKPPIFGWFYIEFLVLRHRDLSENICASEHAISKENCNYERIPTVIPTVSQNLAPKQKKNKNAF